MGITWRRLVRKKCCFHSDTEPFPLFANDLY